MHGTPQPALGDGDDVSDSLIRIGMAGRGGIVVNAKQEYAAVGVGEGSHIFGNEISHRPATERLPPVVLQVPQGLELNKLTLALTDKAFQFRCRIESLH